MSPGTYISFTLHASLVGWLLFGGDFDRKPLELPVTEVSVISSEMFDIMLNNTVPIVDTELELELEVAVAQPAIEDSQASADPSIDVAPQRDTQVLRPIASTDAIPQIVLDQPVRMEEVVIIPSIDLPMPEIEADTPEPLETSSVPKPRPVPRIAPIAVVPPAPEIDVGDITQDTATPQVAPAEVIQEQTAKAPEAAAIEIVTEAEKPSDAVEVSRLAPPRSVRPQRRPKTNTPIDEATPVKVQIDPLEAALAEALSGSVAVPEPQMNATEALAPHVIRGMKLAISPCWNLGASSSASLFTTVVVGMQLTIEGKPLAKSIHLVGYEGGDQLSAERAFETAQRAIKECGVEGFKLPKDQYTAWQNMEITFNPEKMRMR